MRAPAPLTRTNAAPWGLAIQCIAEERRRQVYTEGWTAQHDDEHGQGEMTQAAVCYAMGRTRFGDAYGPEDLWPLSWDRSWWKPGDYRRNLVKAGALIAAEIERLDRASSTAPKP